MGSLKLSRMLIKMIDDISDDLKPLLINICSFNVGKLSESNQKRLFNAATPFLNSAFVQTFLVQFFKQIKASQQLGYARKLTKQALYSEGANYKKLLNVFKNQSPQLIYSLASNFIREFTIYQQQCRQG